MNPYFIKIFVLLALLFSGYSVCSQTIEGKVLSEEEDIADIHVINLSTGKATITNTKGFFSLSAHVGDSIRFSAVQLTTKDLVVRQDMLTGFIVLTLSKALTELEEVVVWPYSLSGDLYRDMKEVEIEPITTAATLDLPNANVKKRIQSERLLYTARTWDFRVVSVKLDPLINAISGRTKMLKRRVARDLQDFKYKEVYDSFEKSSLAEQLNIPKQRIFHFFYFCEADPHFNSIVGRGVKGDVLDFMVSKSAAYREMNALD